MNGTDVPTPAGHIRLTSHHPFEGSAGAPKIHWGAADPQGLVHRRVPRLLRLAPLGWPGDDRADRVLRV